MQFRKTVFDLGAGPGEAIPDPAAEEALTAQRNDAEIGLARSRLALDARDQALRAEIERASLAQKDKAQANDLLGQAADRELRRMLGLAGIEQDKARLGFEREHGAAMLSGELMRSREQNQTQLSVADKQIAAQREERAGQRQDMQDLEGSRVAHEGQQNAALASASFNSFLDSADRPGQSDASVGDTWRTIRQRAIDTLRGAAQGLQPPQTEEELNAIFDQLSASIERRKQEALQQEAGTQPTSRGGGGGDWYTVGGWLNRDDRAQIAARADTAIEHLRAARDQELARIRALGAPTVHREGRGSPAARSRTAPDMPPTPDMPPSPGAPAQVPPGMTPTDLAVMQALQINNARRAMQAQQQQVYNAQYDERRRQDARGR